MKKESPVVEGVVVRQDARGCRIRTDAGDERWCPVRGRVHLAGSATSTTTVSVGDRVEVRLGGPDRGTIEAILPRRSVLSRPDPHHERRQHVLAANVDQVVIAAACADPEFAAGFVDRLLAAAEWSRLDAVVVANKRDLVANEPPQLAVYRALGYRVVVTSAARGEGIEELRATLLGRVSVITGHSGVGKSSLLNLIEPGLALKVGLVNAVSHRGRHTTTAAVLVPLAGGGAVVDTPGIREFGLFNVPRTEVGRLFRELVAVADGCKFGNCLHRGEPGCAAAAAVEAGTVAAWRLESYQRMLETLPDVKAWEIRKASES